VNRALTTQSAVNAILSATQLATDSLANLSTTADTFVNDFSAQLKSHTLLSLMDAHGSTLVDANYIDNGNYLTATKALKIGTTGGTRYLPVSIKLTGF